MRRFAPRFLGFLLVCALLPGAEAVVCAQSSRTTPLPVSNVARTRLFPRRQAEEQEKEQPQPEPPTTIPKTPPPSQPQKPTTGQTDPATTDPATAQQNAVLALAKQAIDVNKRRMLDPTKGFSPWMIMHGVLALRQEYTLSIGNQPVNAIEYVTQQNPLYAGALPDPTQPGSPIVPARGHYFESTAYGGRAHPYVVSFAFEGHPNQFLAILSMSDLPLTHRFKVSDSQKPGAEKFVTMADMVRHAQMDIHVGNPNEVAWTLWFLANYIEPDAKWTDKSGTPWSMEQLVTVQTNAPLFAGGKDVAPCGGTHGLFALACACNSYQQKFGKLDGAWLRARQKLDQHIQFAQNMQNRDGTFSSAFFRASEWSAEMGPRFKSSGHMLEWLMMALPAEQLEQQWVKNAVSRVANDLIYWQNAPLKPAETGAMYHAVHALVLYRNRIEPPTSVTPPERMAELPPEMKHPAPGTPQTPTTPPMNSATVPPAPITPAPMTKGTDPKTPPVEQPEATIRLINPAINKLLPLGNVRPILRPITESKDTPAKPIPSGTPAPPPTPEKLGGAGTSEPAQLPLAIPTKPALEKPTPQPPPKPAPSEPKSEGALVVPLTKEEGGIDPVPLFEDEPEEQEDESTDSPSPAASPEPPAAKPVEEKKPGEEKKPEPPLPAPPPSKPAPAPSLVPPLPEPTPPKSPSSSD